MDERLLTIGQLRDILSKSIEEHPEVRAASILWVHQVRDGDDFSTEYLIAPGSLTMGVEWIEENKKCRGTMKIEPPPIAKRMN